MGTYFKAGIAMRIAVGKKSEYRKTFTKEEVMEKLKHRFNLDLYTVDENEEVILFNLKEEICKKYLSDFILEQLDLYLDQNHERLYMAETLDMLAQLQENPTIEGIEEVTETIYNAYIGHCSNDYMHRTYLDRELDIYLEGLYYIYEGKMFAECDTYISTYIHTMVRVSSENPLKDTVFVSFD